MIDIEEEVEVATGFFNLLYIIDINIIMIDLIVDLVVDLL